LSESTDHATEPLATLPQARATPLIATWHSPQRGAFRFAFSYFTLYNASALMGIVGGFAATTVTYIAGLVSGAASPGAGTATNSAQGAIYGFVYAPITAFQLVMRTVVPWVGKHVLQLPKDITIFPAGSGDTTYNYVEILVFAAIAMLITVVWSIVAHIRRNGRHAAYVRLHDLLRIQLRYVLAMTLIGYGLSKVFVSQFPAPSLDALVTTYGESSPMGILWRFIGASAPYEIFSGVMECLGGVLLLWRRTTTLGALVTIAVMTNVVMLNYCYDVPVKLYSSHLLLMAAFLTLPESRRLFRLFFLNRPVEAAVLRPVVAPLWWRLARCGAKYVFLGVTLVTTSLSHYTMSQRYGSAAPKPALYGLYDVESFNADGTDLPPLLTDTKRWRRVIVDRWGGVSLAKMDGGREYYSVLVDETARTIALSAPRQRLAAASSTEPAPTPLATFAFGRPEPDRLIIEGTLNGVKLDVKLKRVDESSMLLLNRGFHWVNEYPFNR